MYRQFSVCFERKAGAKTQAGARMWHVDLRGEVVNAGGGRHGGREVAFVGEDVVVGDVVAK